MWQAGSERRAPYLFWVAALEALAKGDPGRIYRGTEVRLGEDTAAQLLDCTARPGGGRLHTSKSCIASSSSATPPGDLLLECGEVRGRQLASVLVLGGPVITPIIILRQVGRVLGPA